MSRGILEYNEEEIFEIILSSGFYVLYNKLNIFPSNAEFHVDFLTKNKFPNINSTKCHMKMIYVIINKVKSCDVDDLMNGGNEGWL